ncbi:MAG TPA: hypothetical protein VLF88_01405 [Candidatus Babeliales bacterium]|nr:hypothetical protein [Candidatus Babeliales bacterium]
MFSAFLSSVLAGSIFFAALPATNNYQLNSYGFGSGGTANSNTSNYSLEGISGEVSSQPTSTSNYSALPGFVQTQQANEPKVTLTNPSNYYDKLKFVIDEQGNPADALYALQISTTSDFSSGNNYVKSDNTIGPTLTLADYQTYSAWGGASGANVIGLSSATTYYLRAKATQGQFTESGYGPGSSSSTVGQSISFCLYTGANCAAGGNSVAFGNLLPATEADSPNNIGVDFATNADFGGNVYVYSLNGGLRSSAASYTITSATADLSSASEGFGAQIASASQSSGGPFSKVSPYDGAGNNVGGLSMNINTIFTSSAPLSGGSGAIQLKVRPSNTTPEATDYSDVITVIAAAAF